MTEAHKMTRYVAVLITIILSISICFIPEVEILEFESELKLSTQSSNIEIIIVDSNGNGVNGTEIIIIDAWTDLTVVGPHLMTENREWFTNLSAGSVRIYATHPNYVSTGTYTNISSESPNEATILLTPLNSILNISGTANSTVSLTLNGELEDRIITLNNSGNGSFAVPNSGNGWLLYSFEEHKSLTYWNGENQLVMENNGSMLIHGNSTDVNNSGTLRIEHHPSGFWDLIEWNGGVNTTIPRTYLGEWKIFNHDNGLRVGQPLKTNDKGDFNISGLINDPTIWPTPKWGGQAFLNMTETPQIGAFFNLTWEADFHIPMDFGSTLLPKRSVGLSQQIDYWAGNRDGNISGMEISSFSDYQNENMWVESNHLFLFDEKPLTGDVERSNFSITQNEPIGASYYSWSESATLTAQSSFGSSRIFWFPVRGDAIENIPITINLPDNWEVRYSPQIDYISGGQSNFTINRSLSPTVGIWTVTIGPNQAPIANAHLLNHSGIAIPHEKNSTIVSDCTDSGVGNLNNRWEYTREGYWQYSHPNQTHTFIPKELGFYHGDILNVTLICSDWDEATSFWQEEYYIDGMPPVATLNVTEDTIIGNTLYHEIEEINGFSIRAGSTVTVITNTTDDSGSPVQAIWRSNKSLGWEHFDGFEDIFNQGNEVNWMHMTVEERHKQRELTHYSLELELLDSAQNSNISTWDITILDATPPTITAEVMVDGYPIGSLNQANLGSEISLNLSRSFDDIDAIELIEWYVSIDDQIIVNNGSWDDVRILTLPQLDIGIHELRIAGIDSSGNVREVVSNPIVEPQKPSNITGVEIDVEGGAVIGSPGIIQVTIKNIGSNKADLTICYHGQCSTAESGVANHENPSITTIPLTINEYQGGRIIVDVEWSDQESNERGNFTINSDIIPMSQWAENASTVFWLMIFSVIIYFLMIRKSGGTRHTPF